METFKVMGSLERFAGSGADELVRLARENFGVELDYSPASLETLDSEVLGQFRRMLASGKVDDPARVSLFAGSYIGEVLRRQGGYGWANLNGDAAWTSLETFVIIGGGARRIQANVCVWCLKRIVNGPADGIPDKILALQQVAAGGMRPGAPALADGIFRKIRRFFGQ